MHLPNELGRPQVGAQEKAVQTGNMEGGLRVKPAFHPLRLRVPVWNRLACENGEVGMPALAR